MATFESLDPQLREHLLGFLYAPSRLELIQASSNAAGGDPVAMAQTLHETYKKLYAKVDPLITTPVEWPYLAEPAAAIFDFAAAYQDNYYEG